MTFVKILSATALILGLAACEGGERVNKTVDAGVLGSGSLRNLQAGIWIDPNGCDHWIIDDGVEGYLSPRLAPNGRPVCSGTPGQGGIATGTFQAGADIGDSL